MAGWANAERRALADALTAVGADAPTLCEGWTAADLAAHVYVREHRPDATLGVLPLGPLSAYTERVMASALRVHGFDHLVQAIRRPPPLLRVQKVDDTVNTVEMFVHTEDVRRANGLPTRRTARSSRRPCGAGWPGRPGCRFAACPPLSPSLHPVMRR
jgi:uncharacterized protein (TIGR03085 family)